ncbi:chorismate synthase [Alysiella filiformis]|uniref:Chorismate synthase n=1 Tax=Alysiella filiformis DSM 16848 TaxID=1120981 RepID=A0A286E1P7_9NEIS|nr:chorismate synthase [Alysiella filiformis]QMT30773.1 chorismate synthase [Alysiella filiformis]UBQ56246.1 chorismate synthase [Alysiella filiformis DSM 16848]SOD64813.1 chorismate synthase [Alysiella filiformis DSM 16848]
MAGNTFGQIFTVTTFGESHGAGLGCIIDGCPPNLPLTEADIQADLDRRKPGTSRHVTQRREPDQVEILSGVFEGKTTGTPIALLIRNTDQRSKDYGKIAEQFRPAHADYTYWHKFGTRDYRGGGRSSARETAARVAAGAVAKKWLREQFGTEIICWVTQVGEKAIAFEHEDLISQNPFFAANQSQITELEDYMDSVRKSLDSVGAKLHIEARNVPVGLGEPVFDRLDADIAHALMSINAVKAVEIGDGFDVVAQRGSFHGDELTPTGFKSNRAGGILGGISTGQTITANFAIKPTSSIATPRESIDIYGNSVEIATHGRHDPCVGLRAAPIAEAMLALVLIDHALRHRAQNADVRVATPDIARLGGK